MDEIDFRHNKLNFSWNVSNQTTIIPESVDWRNTSYIKLGRGPQYIDGQCGILLEASYPVL
jgi:hypothetical protein